IVSCRRPETTNHQPGTTVNPQASKWPLVSKRHNKMKHLDTMVIEGLRSQTLDNRRLWRRKRMVAHLFKCYLVFDSIHLRAYLSLIKTHRSNYRKMVGRITLIIGVGQGSIFSHLEMITYKNVVNPVFESRGKTETITCAYRSVRRHFGNCISI